jgi:TetR/AcrR family transcriptional repressor of mexJK operon
VVQRKNGGEMTPIDPILAEEGSRPERRARRRAAIIATARQLFLDKGFENVTLSEIVRESGGSLSTLYEMFESKEGLLRAVVRSAQHERSGKIAEIGAAGDTPFETLRQVALVLSQEFLNRDKIALLRIVMAESLRNPSFAHDVYKGVHLPFVAAIEAIFARWRDSGMTLIEDPHRAASFFVGAVIHAAQTQALCGDLSTLLPDARAVGCAEAAALFVRAYGLETSS